MESPDRFSSSSSPIKSTTSSPYSKHHLTPPGSKSPGYTQTRKPAVGSSRPLPSPGKEYRTTFFHFCFNSYLTLQMSSLFFLVCSI